MNQSIERIQKMLKDYEDSLEICQSLSNPSEEDIAYRLGAISAFELCLAVLEGEK